MKCWNFSIRPAKMALDVKVVGHVDEVLEFLNTVGQMALDVKVVGHVDEVLEFLNTASQNGT